MEQYALPSSQDVERAISFAQKFNDRLVYSIKKDANPLTGSPYTTYKQLHTLVSLNLATLGRDKFAIKSNVVSQPLHVLEKLIPSLFTLKNAKRFGKFYNESDVNFAKKNLPGIFLTTLDYAAWELTKYQMPSDFYVYVNDVDKVEQYLIEKGFSKGSSGRVILLPMFGNFENKIERIYLDCMANGGRSILDAIAIELRYGEQLQVKGYFPLELMKKVQEENQLTRINESTST